MEVVYTHIHALERCSAWCRCVSSVEVLSEFSFACLHTTALRALPVGVVPCHGAATVAHDGVLVVQDELLLNLVTHVTTSLIIGEKGGLGGIGEAGGLGVTS